MAAPVEEGAVAAPVEEEVVAVMVEEEWAAALDEERRGGDGSGAVVSEVERRRGRGDGRRGLKSRRMDDFFGSGNTLRAMCV